MNRILTFKGKAFLKLLLSVPELQTLEQGIGNLLLYNTRQEQPTTQKLSCSQHARRQVEAFE